MTKAEWRVLEMELRNWPHVRAVEFRARLRAARSRRRKPSQPEQYTFPYVLVQCPADHGLIRLCDCIIRASAKTASGAGRGYPVHEACGSCPIRDEHRAMAPKFAARRFLPFNVQHINAQRAARQRDWQSGKLSRIPTQDDPPAGDEE